MICSELQTHNSRVTAITEKNELIETRGEDNPDISAGKLDAGNVIKHLIDLSERFTPNVAVASAALPVTNNWATQFALPSKNKQIRTAARTRKQLDVNMPPIPYAQKFIRCDSGSNGHERIILCGEPKMLRVLETLSFWLAGRTLKLLQNRSIRYIQFLLV